MDYNLLIFAVLGGILLVAIISTTINHRKKTKSNQQTCVVCRGMGFRVTYTSKPIPPCKKCNGTGYVSKSERREN